MHLQCRHLDANRGAELARPKLSNSPFLLGLDAFLGGIPIFLFSLIGGVVADRIERRKVLLISQCVQMGCAFLLTALIAFHLVHVWQIFCLSFVAGFAQLANPGKLYRSSRLLFPRQGNPRLHHQAPRLG